MWKLRAKIGCAHHFFHSHSAKLDWPASSLFFLESKQLFWGWARAPGFKNIQTCIKSAAWTVSKVRKRVLNMNSKVRTVPQISNLKYWFKYFVAELFFASVGYAVSFSPVSFSPVSFSPPPSRDIRKRDILAWAKSRPLFKKCIYCSHKDRNAAYWSGEFKSRSELKQWISYRHLLATIVPGVLH